MKRTKVLLDARKSKIIIQKLQSIIQISVTTTGGTGVYIETKFSSGNDIPSRQQIYAQTAQHSEVQR
jgi:hypothetical protein